MGSQINMTKVKQLKFLMRCAHLFAKHAVCNTPSIEHWWKIVRYCHKKGYMYVGFDKDHIDLAVIAYRIPEISEETTNDTIPEREYGNTLFVLAAVSESTDPWKLFHLFNWYATKHKDLKRICYHFDNDSNKLNVLDIRRDRHGRIKQSVNSASTEL